MTLTKLKFPYYQVDAFASKVFSGNPAGVCLLDHWLPDALLQSIAAENYLPETAFLVLGDEGYMLRWFTPVIEVDLCGHATLASAHVIFAELGHASNQVDFTTKSGLLSVSRMASTGVETSVDGSMRLNQLRMSLPARKPVKIDPPALLREALGAEPLEVYSSVDLLVVLNSQADVESLLPDLRALLDYDELTIVVTAPGQDCDFVSRVFAPKIGVPEDPVTGSAHCSLIPYWAERLGKSEMVAKQLSRRGGELECTLKTGGDWVTVGGCAVTYLAGELTI
ncbi:MAG: PhzF family phenazine biosynthesis protein [Planctomycetes bacterium]|nr:PhzF family phenazine biosynthesis protein [Planctomycetota bacterium]